jgi:hypothetical protein
MSLDPSHTAGRTNRVRQHVRLRGGEPRRPDPPSGFGGLRGAVTGVSSHFATLRRLPVGRRQQGRLRWEFVALGDGNMFETPRSLLESGFGVVRSAHRGDRVCRGK